MENVISESQVELMNKNDSSEDENREVKSGSDGDCNDPAESVTGAFSFKVVDSQSIREGFLARRNQWDAAAKILTPKGVLPPKLSSYLQKRTCLHGKNEYSDDESQLSDSSDVTSLNSDFVPEPISVGAMKEIEAEIPDSQLNNIDLSEASDHENKVSDRNLLSEMETDFENERLTDPNIDENASTKAETPMENTSGYSTESEEISNVLNTSVSINFIPIKETKNYADDDERSVVDTVHSIEEISFQEQKIESFHILNETPVIADIDKNDIYMNTQTKNVINEINHEEERVSPTEEKKLNKHEVDKEVIFKNDERDEGSLEFNASAPSMVSRSDDCDQENEPNDAHSTDNIELNRLNEINANPKVITMSNKGESDDSSIKEFSLAADKSLINDGQATIAHLRDILKRETHDGINEVPDTMSSDCMIESEYKMENDAVENEHDRRALIEYLEVGNSDKLLILSLEDKNNENRNGEKLESNQNLIGSFKNQGFPSQNDSSSTRDQDFENEENEDSEVLLLNPYTEKSSPISRHVDLCKIDDFDISNDFSGRIKRKQFQSIEQQKEVLNLIFGENELDNPSMATSDKGTVPGSSTRIADKNQSAFSRGESKDKENPNATAICKKRPILKDPIISTDECPTDSDYNLNSSESFENVARAVMVESVEKDRPVLAPETDHPQAPLAKPNHGEGSPIQIHHKGHDIVEVEIVESTAHGWEPEIYHTEAPSKVKRSNTSDISLTTESMTSDDSASSLPDANLVQDTGTIYTRISWRSLLSKKWQKSIWMLYGQTSIYIFRSDKDMASWLTNPHLTRKERKALIKVKFDFLQEIRKTQVRGYTLTPIKTKIYKKDEPKLYNFKLEKWMELDKHLLAAFASKEKEELEVFRLTVISCLDNCPHRGLKSIKDLLVQEKKDTTFGCLSCEVKDNLVSVFGNSKER